MTTTMRDDNDDDNRTAMDERPDHPERLRARSKGRGRRRGNGEGTVYQRRDGRWEAAVTLPGTAGLGGGRKRFYGATRREVQEKLTAALRQRDQGLPLLRDERQTLGDYLAGWLDTLQPPRLEPKTYRRYRELVRLHIVPTLGKVPLTRLSAQQVQALYSAKITAGLSSTTVRKLHMVLHAALRRAVRQGVVPRNVTELVDAPRNARAEIHPLTKDEVDILLTAARGDRYEALYIVAVTTGMRQGELLGLHWRDVDLEGRCLHVRTIVQRIPAGIVFKHPKTHHSRRRIGIAPFVVEALRRHRVRQVEERLRLGEAWAAGWEEEHADLVFPSTIGTPLEGEHLSQRQFKPLLRRAGLPPVRFHDLRHTAATIALAKNLNPKKVSEMLGHSTVAITLDLYSHFLPHMQQDIADAMETLFGLSGDEEERGSRAVGYGEEGDDQ